MLCYGSLTKNNDLWDENTAKITGMPRLDKIKSEKLGSHRMEEDRAVKIIWEAEKEKKKKRQTKKKMGK